MLKLSQIVLKKTMSNSWQFITEKGRNGECDCVDLEKMALILEGRVEDAQRLLLQEPER